jgi:hypothetical protein
MVICRQLRDRQIEIRHIIDHEAMETQSDMEKRLIAQLKRYPDMFKDTGPNALIERAYDVQGDRIAYVEKSERTELLGRPQAAAISVQMRTTGCR